MASRSSLPVYLVGALGTASAGLGFGFGLGQYTVTGMDPFIGVVRSSQAVVYQSDVRENEFAAAQLDSASDDLNGILAPSRPGY